MKDYVRQLRSKAQKARRAADEFAGDKSACSMRSFANELERRADAIELDGDTHLRQVTYQSEARARVARADLDAILVKSRRYNGIDGITGLLWSDGDRFTQLLEGPPDSVASTLRRIIADKRHRNIQIIVDQLVEERAFGDWSMAHLSADRGEAHQEWVAVLLAGAPANVREAFAQLMGSA